MEVTKEKLPLYEWIESEPLNRRQLEEQQSTKDAIECMANIIRKMRTENHKSKFGYDYMDDENEYNYKYN